MTRPSGIKRHHLERLAVGYGRQSTAGQVEKNTGSNEYQRAQVRFPQEWGWPPERIVWLDDFGLSGTAADHRPAYRRLRGMIREGQVGVVCVSDHSRLGRNAAEWLLFVADCVERDVLIAIDGKIVDLGDTSDRLHTGLMAVLAEHDGLNRRDTLQHGRKAKLEAGKAVSSPPIGYDRAGDGKWELASEPAIRAAIAAVFREFFHARSLRSTVIRLREQGTTIPRRKPGQPIHWVSPSVGVVQDILTNMNYTPDYRYRRRVDDHTKPRSAKGRYRVRKAKPEEVKIIANHHEGYVTHEQWAEIMGIFRTNTWSSEHPYLGDGRGLAQGLPRCSIHGNRMMATHYKRGKEGSPRSHSYRCRGDYDDGGDHCRSIPGGRFDDVIGRLVLERLAPPSVAVVKAAFDRAMADGRAEQRHREIEKARLRQRVMDLEQKLDVLDPDSFNVFKTVERNLEQATRALATLEGVDDTKRELALKDDAAMLAEAEGLAGEVTRIWRAPTTTHQDRKELVRILVRTILVEERHEEWLSIRVKWADGARDTVAKVWLPKGVRALLVESTKEGMTSDQIAAHLDRLGINNRRGNALTPRENPSGHLADTEGE